MIKTYVATRVITKGNFLFRDKIIIDDVDEKLTYWKRNSTGIGHQEITLNFRDIACVNLITRLQWFFFCNISIETRGGSQIIASGFSKDDAKEIKSLVGF